MNYSPSVRALRQAMLAQAASNVVDDVALESLRNDISSCVQEVRQAINRAIEFASKGLVSEAASLAEDFPDLAAQALMLKGLPGNDRAIARVWEQCIDPDGPLGWLSGALPTEDEVDRIAMLSTRATEMRTLLDAYRSASLRREPIANRLKILARLRREDEHNRMWLDQIQALEIEWLKWAVDLRGRPSSREELEVTLATLREREWIASVPRGLAEEIHERLRPMRGEIADRRYREIAEAVHAAWSASDRASVERLETEWANVYHQTGRMPDEAVAADVQPAFDWVGRHRQEMEDAARFEGVLDELERMLAAKAPTADVERKIAEIRNSGRSVREGLLERAEQYLEADRARVRRRKWFFVLASVAVVALIAAGIGLVIWMRQSAQAEGRSRVQLIGHLDAKQWREAESVAATIRESHPDPAPETAAALDRFDREHREWKAVRDRVAGVLAAAEKDLKATPNRATIARIQASLQPIRKDVEADERKRLDSLDESLRRATEGFDASGRESVRTALAEVDRLLSDWPPPDRWSDAERSDSRRWAEYSKAMADAMAILERAAPSVAGFGEGESQIADRRDAIGTQQRDASDRQAAIAAAENALSDDSIGAPVGSESEFVARISKVMADHRAELTARRLLSDFQAASASAPAWLALEAWRQQYEPQLSGIIKGSAEAALSPEAASAGLELVDRYLFDHSASPLRPVLERLRGSLEVGPVEETYSAADLGTVLAAASLADLERVEVRPGDGRFYYRRTGGTANLSNNVIKSVEDLAKLPMTDDEIRRGIRDEEKLTSILLPPGQSAVQRREEPISMAWKDALDRTGDAKSSEVAGLILGLVRSIRSDRQAEVMFQLYAMQKAADILRRSGLAPTAVREPLAAWEDRLRRDWRDGMKAAVLWPQAGLGAGGITAKAREQAADALKAFPDFDQVRNETAAARSGIAAELGPFRPEGVLMPASAGSPRVIRDSRFSGTIYLVRESNGAFQLVEARAERGQVDVSGLRITGGPTLAFRRVD